MPGTLLLSPQLLLHTSISFYCVWLVFFFDTVSHSTPSKLGMQMDVCPCWSRTHGNLSPSASATRVLKLQVQASTPVNISFQFCLHSRVSSGMLKGVFRAAYNPRAAFKLRVHSGHGELLRRHKLIFEEEDWIAVT